MSGDLARMMEQLQWDQDIAKAPVTRPLRDSQMEEIIQNSIDEGIRIVNYDHSDADQHYARCENTDRMIGWMRIGHRMAVKRYAGSDGCDLEWLFRQIAEDVDKRFKHGDEGDQLHVRVNAGTREFKINRTYLEDMGDYD